MCTLAFAWQVFRDAPVALAATRDEFVDRPSEPPAPRDWETRVVAPVDRVAGGTWLGYNEHGLLVAITNRPDGREVDGPRSRGLLVRDALAYDRAETAVRFVERELDARAYEGFRLFVADDRAALVVTFDGRPRVRPLDPGVGVLVSGGHDSSEADSPGQAARADTIRTALQPEPGGDADGWLDRAGSVLADHEYGCCVHGDRFGTRSSARLRIGTPTRFEFADGPPCRTDYERVDGFAPP